MAPTCHASLVAYRPVTSLSAPVNMFDKLITYQGTIPVTSPKDDMNSGVSFLVKLQIANDLIITYRTQLTHYALTFVSQILTKLTNPDMLSGAKVIYPQERLYGADPPRNHNDSCQKMPPTHYTDNEPLLHYRYRQI